MFIRHRVEKSMIMLMPQPGTKYILASILGLYLILSGCNFKASRTMDKPPNIIFFFVDDMGWQDTEVPLGIEKSPINNKFKTPNMLRLASEGMKFTQAYAYAVCSPSRTSLMTGMNAARHGVTNWTLRKNITVDANDDALEFPKWNLNGLQPESVDTIPQTVSATTLSQLLKQHGYFTIHCGKAHWGAEGTPGSNPLNLGFDINIGGHSAGGPGSYLGTNNFSAAFRKGDRIWDIPGLEKYHGKDINLTDALTLEAKIAMDSAIETGKPFYLYMSHYTVHVPLEPHQPFYQQYKNKGLNEQEARYAAMIEGMDNSLGELMNYLDKKGIADNTVILFMSDNGGLSVSDRGETPHMHNLPLKSGKGSAYEGGIRVPMLVKWPGQVTSNSVCNNYLIIEDCFPSLLEIAGIKRYKTIQQVDGQSFAPLLRQAVVSKDQRDLFWHFPNNWGPKGPGIGTTSTIRHKEWKLIYWYKDQRVELYNVKEDIGELNDLAEKHPEKVRELAIRLGNHLRKVNAFRPTYKKTGDLAPWPDQAVR
ncbi:MAG: sulfatase [bacterium]